jgi:hypothetical protein
MEERWGTCTPVALEERWSSCASVALEVNSPDLNHLS